MPRVYKVLLYVVGYCGIVVGYLSVCLILCCKLVVKNINARAKSVVVIGNSRIKLSRKIVVSATLKARFYRKLDSSVYLVLKLTLVIFKTVACAKIENCVVCYDIFLYVIPNGVLIASVSSPCLSFATG